jgi:hypothetical protein
MNNDRKPPIGIIPKKIWQEIRFRELCQAILRYLEADIMVPKEWIDEYYILYQEITKKL